MKKLIMIMIACFAQSCFAQSLDHLIGKLDATYHIRVDILEHINTSAVPFSRAWHHLIRIAQNKQHLYYYAKTYTEAEESVKENSIEQKCLALEYTDQETAYQQMKEIDDMYGDTRDRREHIFEVSKYYFSRRGFIHPKLTTKELYDRCNNEYY